MEVEESVKVDISVGDNIRPEGSGETRPLLASKDFFLDEPRVACIIFLELCGELPDIDGSGRGRSVERQEWEVNPVGLVIWESIVITTSFCSRSPTLSGVIEFVVKITVVGSLSSTFSPSFDVFLIDVLKRLHVYGDRAIDLLVVLKSSLLPLLLCSPKEHDDGVISGKSVPTEVGDDVIARSEIGSCDRSVGNASDILRRSEGILRKGRLRFLRLWGRCFILRHV
jgi:hypothetical protein